MSHGSGGPENSSWGQPECPGCESDVFVAERPTRGTTWVCHLCGTEWATDQDGAVSLA